MIEPPVKHKHHHVPEFHLKKWYGEDGKFFAYKKNYQGIVSFRKRTAGMLFYEPDLYLLKEDESSLANNYLRPDAIEDQLKDIDDKAAPVLNKMLRSFERISRLTDEERTNWAQYVYSLINRTPKKVRELEEVGEQSLQKTSKELSTRSTDEDSRRTIKRIIDISRLSNMHFNIPKKMMLDERLVTRFVEALIQHRWNCFEVSSHTFVIGPDPVMSLHIKSTPDSPVVVFALALSPRRLWITFHKELDELASREDFLKRLAFLYNTKARFNPQEYIVSQVELKNSPPYNWDEILELGLKPFERHYSV